MSPPAASLSTAPAEVAWVRRQSPLFDAEAVPWFTQYATVAGPVPSTASHDTRPDCSTSSSPASTGASAVARRTRLRSPLKTLQ
jgi:hypothetical protein